MNTFNEHQEKFGISSVQSFKGVGTIQKKTKITSKERHEVRKAIKLHRENMKLSAKRNKKPNEASLIMLSFLLGDTIK